MRATFIASLLLTTTLAATPALAQTGAGSGANTQTPSSPPPASTQPDARTPGAEEEQVDVSTPGANPGAGGDIVVVGENIPNVQRATAQVVSVLSSADIARTGEGDIAGALGRVTGLSVVGNGFVFVRGLGDRYSSALLNGSPLPSPEPLRRTVPLDIFPTTVVGSALVQKSYSVNYPGEFGGGVINLTTKAIPTESFISGGASISADTRSTSEFGYVYDGGDADWIGYDDGERKTPGFIRDAVNGSGVVAPADVARLSGARTSLLQANNQLPANWSGELSFGVVKDVGGFRLGAVGSASASNSFRTRDISQQDAVEQTGNIRNDFRTVLTDNRIVANALLGLGVEFGENTVRLTNVYIHDTLKQARGSVATVYTNSSGQPRFQQNTNWFERQLIETQLVGEFKPTDKLSVDLRGAYANSRRDAPYERQFDYLCASPPQGAPAGAQVVVGQATGGGRVQCPGVYQATNTFGPFAQVTFSDLEENLYSGQADVAYQLGGERPFSLSGGYFYSDQDRNSTRYPFVFQTTAGGALPYPCNLFRPDYLLSADVVNGACLGTQIQLRLTGAQAGALAYDAALRIHAGYVQAEAEALDGLRATIGVRYETAKETVLPSGLSATPLTGTRLNNDYFLPAATLTWNFAADMQVRAHFSKTIARPQFRELAPQQFQDPDSDRLFFGNPLLRDSQLYNLEARYEWFFARGQRFSVAGFYKRIDNPIEQVGFRPTPDARLQTGFTYLPRARLYGVEAEVQKYFSLSGLGSFFATRRALAIVNYTYTQSSITADGTLVPDIGQGVGATALRPASQLFVDGGSLTGQSDHLVNVQLGLEDTSTLSQVTLLFSYASDRVTNRGPANLSGVGFLPDIVEHPGIRLDLVARQGFEIAGGRFEVKAEARNLTGTDYVEDQRFSNGSVVNINRFGQGRIFSLGVSATF